MNWISKAQNNQKKYYREYGMNGYMNYAKCLAISLIVIFLVGCGTTQPTKFTPDGSGIIKAQAVDPMYLNDVQWKAIRTEEEYYEFVDEYGNVLIVLTPEQAKNLFENISEMMRYIRDQRGTINYYERVVDRINEVEKEQ